jgi:oligoendopeptidase F
MRELSALRGRSLDTVPLLRVVIVAAALALLTRDTIAQERDRAKVPERYTWNLTDIYPSDATWREAKDRLAARLGALREFKGRVTSSAATLATVLETRSALDKELSRLFTYANLLADQDTRESRPQGMRQEMVQLSSQWYAEAAYIDPEILRADRATLQRLVDSEPRLEPYRFAINDLVRRSTHTLSDGEEKLMADAGTALSAPASIFGIIQNADFPYPKITLSDGRQVTVDQAGYAAYRALPNRADREKVMSAFFTSLATFERTFGSTINGEVQKVLFTVKARHYNSALEAVLDSPNIPTSVYTRLVDGVNRALPVFHRYLKLRQRMLGVDQLHYYDVYAPLVDAVKLTYTPEEMERLVLAALAPLGPDYQTNARRAFDGRWIDLMPTEGKVTGAYSTGGAFDVHPYMSINYNGQYIDVSTVAHELGHSMHSYYASHTQPYPRAGHPTFVAEVASTFNESLLNDYMLKTVTDDDARVSLLGSYLENIKQTLFRQTQFAEFELAMHKMAQAGQPITGEALSRLYLSITRKYYGHDQGICVVDDYVAHEWSMVPHFYLDFYVFQYATSFTASEALAQKVKSGDLDARRKYLAFLSAGGSKYPIDLLKDAGVDMTTDEPLDLTLKEMNGVMDEIERILAQRR